MAKERNKLIRNAILVFIGIWFVLPNIASLTGFLLLMLTHQVKYTGMLNSPRLPLIYTPGFEYTRSSLLHYFAPTSTPFIKAVAFNSFAFVAYNPEILKDRPNIITHELRHTLQYTLGGPLTMIIYKGVNDIHRELGYSAWETYLSNPFERDAYRFSGELTRYNELIDQHAPELNRLKFK
jgi:hypothetical protein